MTIAVNLGGKPDPDFTMPEIDDDDDNDLMDKVTDFLKQLAPKQTPSKDSLGLVEISDSVFDAMQGAIARQQLAGYPPDVELVVPINVCGMLEFERAREMIRLGRELAERQLGSSAGHLAK